MKTFMALYMGTDSPDERAATVTSQDDIARGIAAWQAWMTTNADRIVDAGGPLGATRKVSKAGVADIHNRVAAYVIVRADSHEEAASLFEGHPHFTIFPGDSVEIMERLPIPGA